MSEKENLISMVELIIRRASNKALNDIVYRLGHDLKGDILQIVGEENISETMQKLAEGGSLDFELELASAVKTY